MKPEQALKLTDRFQDAIALLYIHGILAESERDKARKRMDKWAASNCLTRKA